MRNTYILRSMNKRSIWGHKGSLGSRPEQMKELV